MKRPKSPERLDSLIRNVRLIAFDFDGVFTDNAVYVDEKGRELVRCWRSDGLGLKKLKSLDIRAVIISTEKNPVVSRRAAKLKVECIQGVEDKERTLSEIARKEGIDFGQIAYVGNDINDLACLRAVGLPIVVEDAHPAVVPFAKYRTRIKGGNGAVREICDLFEATLGPQRGGRVRT
jgi:3-deoxy-D-manno-octulosonate 8-phosphate phosphatase (KDO 8-P phosphatase)